MANIQMGGVFDPTRDVALQQTLTVSGTTTSIGPYIGPISVISITATGATGSAAADSGILVPAILNVTGTSGAGINLNTGCVAGTELTIHNAMTGALNIYSVGGTINGTTGTTAVSLTATGNKTINIYNTAAGTWVAYGNT